MHSDDRHQLALTESEMKVRIAGATGAIGKPLLSCLDDAGHELFVLIRSRKEAGTR